MDVMMPGMDGIRTTMKIRETSSVPIIFLSAKSEDVDKILGLKIGADDYITKPFNPLELTARVKSLLRRYTQLGAIAENKPAVFRIGGLVMDDERKEVTVDGEPVKLTPIEMCIRDRLQPYVEECCDRLEYEGSMMYDEYPDRLSLLRKSQEVWEQAQNRENFGEHSPDWAQISDLTGVLLLQEMLVRRTKKRRR